MTFKSSLAKKINEVLERNDQKSDDEFIDSLDNLRPPSFDEYVNQIKKCDNLLDALRIRDTIHNEILKKRNEIGKFLRSLDTKSMQKDLELKILSMVSKLQIQDNISIDYWLHKKRLTRELKLLVERHWYFIHSKIFK